MPDVNKRLTDIVRTEPVPKISVALAISTFRRRYGAPKLAHLLTRPVGALSYALLSVPQRCDYNIALWALTGDPDCIRYVLDVADGKRRSSMEARASAAWAVGSLAAQCPAWKAAVGDFA